MLRKTLLFISLLPNKSKSQFENLLYIDKTKVLNEKEKQMYWKITNREIPWIQLRNKYQKEKFEKIRRVELTETVSSITPPPFLNIIRVPRWKDKKIK